MPFAQENPSESGKQTNPVHKIRKWKTKTHMVRRRRNGQQVWELDPTAEAAAAQQQQQQEEEVDRTSTNDVKKVDTTEMHQGNRETNNSSSSSSSSSRRKDQMAPRSLIRCTR